MEKLVEQLWYGDEKQEEIKLILDCYLKHNIFVCLQSLTSISMAGIKTDCIGHYGFRVNASEFWEFCINEFAEFFNELQPVSQSLKTVYAIYSYVNTAIICLKLMRPTEYFNKGIDKSKLYDYSIEDIIAKMRDMDENFVGTFHLAACYASLYRDTEFEAREYLLAIENIRIKGLIDDRFFSKYASMLGDYYSFIGGNFSASYDWYRNALILNKKNIQANFMLAYFDAKSGRYEDAEIRFLSVLKLLGSPPYPNFSSNGTVDYEMLFKTFIWLAKIYYNLKGRMSSIEYIFYAIQPVYVYKDSIWISKIVDDESVWKILQEHYQNGASTCNLYNILEQWNFLNDEPLSKAIKKITPSKDNSPRFNGSTGL